MVAVFKTTVDSHKDSREIIESLRKELKGSIINFDLEDCDNILRVEADSVNTNFVKKVISEFNYQAKLIKSANI